MRASSIPVAVPHYPWQGDLGGLGGQHMTSCRGVGFEEDVPLRVPGKTRVKLRVVFNAKFEFSDHCYHRIMVAEVFS